MVRLKRAVWILPFLATVVALAPAVHGEETPPDVVLGLRGGVVLVTQDPAGEADSRVGPAFALDALISIADSWMLGLGWLGATTTVDNLAVGTATVSEDVDMTTGLLVLEYHPRFKGFAPYGVVGVGVTRVAFGSTTVGCASNPLIYVICAAALDDDDDESDTVFAAKVGLGLDYFFTLHRPPGAHLGNRVGLQQPG